MPLSWDSFTWMIKSDESSNISPYCIIIIISPASCNRLPATCNLDTKHSNYWPLGMTTAPPGYGGQELGFWYHRQDKFYRFYCDKITAFFSCITFYMQPKSDKKTTLCCLAIVTDNYREEWEEGKGGKGGFCWASLRRWQIRWSEVERREEERDSVTGCPGVQEVFRRRDGHTLSDWNVYVNNSPWVRGSEEGGRWQYQILHKQYGYYSYLYSGVGE